MPERFNLESKESVIQYVPIGKIRVSEKQSEKISRDKVEKHKKSLFEHKGKELLPIDALALEDGTFVIDGNGRHRFFAYKEMGYELIPLNIKQNKGFQPTKELKSKRDERPIHKREQRGLREKKRMGLN